MNRSISLLLLLTSLTAACSCQSNQKASLPPPQNAAEPDEGGVVKPLGWGGGGAGGGGDLSGVTGTDEAGRSPAYNAGTGDYRSFQDPRGLNVMAFGASGRNGQAYGDVSSSTLTLETGYDSEWPDDADPENNAKGWTCLILGAGPSHSVAAPSNIRVAQLGTTGSTTHSYTIVSRSGKLGFSAKATSVEITNGYSYLNKDNYVFLGWDVASGAQGYAIYGRASSDASKWHIADVNGLQTCYRVPCGSASNFDSNDIGDKVTQTGTGDTGTLVGFINADPDNSNNGTLWIVPELGSDTASGDTFDGTGAISVNGHSGTPSGASSQVAACYWHDRGDRFYEATLASGNGDDWSNIFFNRTFCRMPTNGYARLAAGHTTLTSGSGTITGILSIGQDEAEQLAINNTNHTIQIRPFTPRDLCDAVSGHEVYVRGKSVTGNLDGVPGMSIDPHRVGDTIIEPWSVSGKRFKLRRRNGWAMTATDVPEVQQAAVTGGPTGGTYTLTSSTYGTTAGIAPGATAAQFETALRAVPGLESVTAWKTADAATEVQTLTIINNGTPGGTFTITTEFGTTAAINWHANTTTMTSNLQTALRAVSGLSTITVAFSSGDYTAGAIFTITCTGTVGNLTQFTSTDSMTGGVHSLAHVTTTQGTQNTYQWAFVGVSGNTPQMTATSSLTGGSTPGVTITTVTGGSGEDFTPYALNEWNQDGLDLFWRREEADVPVTPPPTSAQNDAQAAIVTAVSGTTLTIDTDPATPGNQGVTTNVDRTPGSASTAGLVLHNDTRAFKLAVAEALASRTTNTVLVPTGDYELITADDADWDLDGSEDYTEFSTNLAALFYLDSATSSLHFVCEKQANVWFRPAGMHGQTDAGGATPISSGDYENFIYINNVADFTWTGGSLNLVPIAEPPCQFYEGYHLVTAFNGNQPRESRFALRNAEVWGFGGVISLSAYRGEQGQTELSYVHLDWGGAGHTAGIVATENLSVDHCKLFGAEGGLRANSSCFYTDTNPPGPTFHLTDSYIYNSRYNQRLRAPHIFISNTVFDECEEMLFEGGTYDAHFDNVSFLNCDIFDNSLYESFGNNCLFSNTGIAYTIGNHVWNGCQVVTNRDDTNTGATISPVTINSGDVTLDAWTFRNTDADGTRGVSVAGGSKVRISNFGVEQDNADEPSLSCSSTFTGDLWVTDSRFVSKLSSVGFNFDSTVGRLHFDNVELENKNTITGEWNLEPCWVDARNCTFKCQVIVSATNLTGTAQAGAAGTITLETGEESATNDAYKGWQIYTTGGTGSGQTRYITAYTASTRVATITSNWTVTPDATTTYELMPPQIWSNNRFESTTADTFAIRGTSFRSNDFNVHPTLSAAMYVRGNTIRGNDTYTPAALASGSQELGRYVTDFVRLDPNAANSTVTGIPEMMGGVEYTFVNVDASSATITYDHDSGVSEISEFLFSTAADIGPDSANKSRTKWRDDTTAKWRDK